MGSFCATGQAAGAACRPHHPRLIVSPAQGIRSGSGAVAQSSEIPVATGAVAPPAPTRNANQENFPVGSWLLPARLRTPIAAYYAFARAADDIADDPAAAPAAKIAALDAMEAVLNGAPGAPANADQAKAARLADSLAATAVPVVHAVELLVAFRQDADKRRYADWEK